MALTDLQQDSNRSIVTDLFGGALAGIGSEAHSQRTAAAVLQFVNARDIILSDLLEGIVRDEKYWQERTLLWELLAAALKDERLAVTDALSSWSSHLHQKQKATGAKVPASLSAESSMVIDLAVRGYVPSYKWGTDVDVVGCLGEDLAGPADIKRPGVYIISPMKVEGYTAVAEEEEEKYSLQECIEAAKRVVGQVTLCVPVSCANRHWRLAEVTMNHGAVTEAKLWDSMGGVTGSKDVASQNLTRFVREKVPAAPEATVHYTDVQRNGFSCMDFSVQQAYRRKFPDDAPVAPSPMAQAIVSAGTNANQLRLMVVKKAAARSSFVGTEVAESLQLEGSMVVGKKTPEPVVPVGAEPPKPEELVTREQTHLYLTMNAGDEQVRFDALYSQKLAQKMRQLRGVAEDVLDKQAFDEAYQEFNALPFAKKLSERVSSFFKSAKKPGADNTPDERSGHGLP